MMSTQRTLWLVLMVALGAVAQANAHEPPSVVYQIQELTDADTALINLGDGNVADWEDILGPPTFTATDFFDDPTVGEGASYNPADLDYRIWLGWHPGSGRLYMAMERRDDVYLNTYPGGNLGDLWAYDSVEFMVDGDHSGGEYNGFDDTWCDAERALNNGRSAQQYLAISEAPDGKLLGFTAWTSEEHNWVVNPPYGNSGGRVIAQNPNVSTIEMYVTPFDNLIKGKPDESMVSRLFANKVIGFQISVPDFDSTPREYHGWHTLSGQAATWRYADRFVDARLVSASPSPAPPPARVRVNIPDGGEKWGAGLVHNIHWFADASIAQVRIEYSVDHGSTWQVVTSSTENDGLYAWTLPLLAPTQQALIRIADPADGNPADISNGVFEVVRPPDFDSNGRVDFADFFTFADAFRPTACGPFDMDRSGYIDLGDFFIFADNFGRAIGDVVIPASPGPGPGPYANAGASFNLAGVNQLEQAVEFSIQADGLAGVKQYEIVLEVEPSESADLGSSRFTTSGPAVALQQAWGNQLWIGVWVPGTALSGSANLGTFSINLNPSYQGGSTFRITRIALGPSSTVQDVFGAEQLDLQLARFNSSIWTWLSRTAVFPNTAVDIFTQVNVPEPTAVDAVQAEILTQDISAPPLAVVPLRDDGIPPDTTAGDHIFSGTWAGHSQPGAYPVNAVAQLGDGTTLTIRPNWPTLFIAHTVLSFPDRLLVSPERLKPARLPLLIEDDGSGYMVNGFLSASLGIGLGTCGDPRLNLAGPRFGFAGTVLQGQNFMIDSLAAFQTGGECSSWDLRVALAGPELLRLIAQPERGQRVLGYVDVDITPGVSPSLMGVDVHNIQFEENPATGGPWVSVALGRGDVDTSRTIDSFDASLVLMGVVGILDLNQPENPSNDAVEGQYHFLLPAFAAYMADASGQMGVTALDASLILQRDVGMITHFPAEEGYYRNWEPPSGWWNPPAPKPVASAPTPRRVVSLGVAEERPGGLLAVPVEIDDLQGVLAGSLTLRYDPALFSPAGVRSTPLTRDYLVEEYAQAGIWRVGFAGARWREGKGAVVEMLLRRQARSGESGGLLSLEAVQLNEGDVEVQIAGGAGTAAGLPGATGLAGNFPNPFNPATSIRYGLDKRGKVELSVYDLAGQRVRQLVSSQQVAGQYEIVWDGRDELGRSVGSGVYLCRLTTQEGVFVGKMLFIK